MHPMMILALVREVERERRRDEHDAQLRSLALSNRAQGFDASHAGRGFARRRRASSSLRPRLS